MTSFSTQERRHSEYSVVLCKVQTLYSNAVQSIFAVDKKYACSSLIV